MRKPFVLEAIMLAIYGECLVPNHPVEYIIPASTIYELEEFYHSEEPIMLSREDDQHVRQVIANMIQYFNDPFTRKKMEKSLIAPWSTVTFPYREEVHFTIIKAEDTAYWGELFDPIETELMLTSMRLKAPLLTDQYDWQERMITHRVAVQFYDIEDLQFAIEEGIMLDLAELKGEQ